MFPGSRPILKKPEEAASTLASAALSFSQPKTLSAESLDVSSSSIQPKAPLSVQFGSSPNLKKPELLAPKITMVQASTQNPALTLEPAICETTKSASLTPLTPSGSVNNSNKKVSWDMSTPELPPSRKPTTLSSPAPAKDPHLPPASVIQKSQQTDIDSHQSNRQSEIVHSTSRSIMLDEGGLMQQFVEFHVPNIVEDCIKQVADERSRKKAKEYRVMKLSIKYIKRWRQQAWILGLRRRAPERRRRVAQAWRDMAELEAREKALMASSSSQKPENKVQGQEKESFADSTLPSSTSKKRKSQEVDDNITPDRVSRNKRSCPDPAQMEKLTSSRRVKADQKPSTTVEKPKLTETEELINLLIATRDDYTYLANGSESSYKIIQKIRTLLPPVKVDDTRTDYFLLKSLGLDPNTSTVPWTSKKRDTDEDLYITPMGIRAGKKRPSDEDISITPSKRLKESPLIKSASTLSPPDLTPSRSTSSWTKSSRKYRSYSAATQSKNFDETENELRAVQRKSDNEISDRIEYYREQRAKFGSGRIDCTGAAPNQGIEYYKEQRAKWGNPAPSSIAKTLRRSTLSGVDEGLTLSSRYGTQSSREVQATKSRMRADMEQRQRKLYASMLQPGPAAVATAPAGSSAEDAIEL